MSEEETPGPVFGDAGGSAPPAPPAQPASPAAPEGGSPGTPPAPPASITRDMLLSAIPEQLRGEAVFQNIREDNPVEDLATQFLHAQKLVGVEKMPAPKENWTDEQWGQLYDRLGRPKTMNDYQMPETQAALDDAAVGQFKELAHKAGLTSKQFQAVVDFHNQYYGNLQTQAETQSDQQLEQGLMTLRQEWGDQYEENLDVAERFFTNNIKDESLRKLILENKQLRNNPGIIKHFHQLARDASEQALKVGDVTSPAAVRSSEQAMAALKKLEMDNRALLFGRAESMSMADKARLAEVVERRAELYKLAYPE